MAILLAARWCELPLATRSSAMPQSLSKTAKIEKIEVTIVGLSIKL